MQEHEKLALQLVPMGVVIAMAKVLLSTEKLTWRVVLGRAILNGIYNAWCRWRTHLDI